MKKIIILILLISTTMFGFGEKILITELSKEEINKTVESIAYLINDGNEVDFTPINDNKYWFKSDNLRMKKDDHGFTLLYDDNKFLKETEDKFVIEDTRENFKASEESIENLKEEIKIKADKILNAYFPKDNYTLIKVGLSTDGVLDKQGNVVEVISMLSPVYVKTINGIAVAGKGARTRLYFKPSGNLIGIKLNHIKSIEDPSLINDPERVNADIEEINEYLNSKFTTMKNIYVEYVYLKDNGYLVPSYGIALIPSKARKKKIRYIPLAEFKSVEVIEDFLKPRNITSDGDLK